MGVEPLVMQTAAATCAGGGVTVAPVAAARAVRGQYCLVDNVCIATG